MPRPRFAPCPPDQVLLDGFQQVRDEMDVPATFSTEALTEAEAAAAAGPKPPDGIEPIDRRELELIAIDPPGSRDIDQAFTALRRKGGYRVYYAIAADTDASLSDQQIRLAATPDQALQGIALDVTAGVGREPAAFTISGAHTLTAHADLRITDVSVATDVFTLPLDHGFATGQAIRYGDGWIPIGGRGGELAQQIAEFRQMAENAGRTGLEVSLYGVSSKKEELEVMKGWGVDRVVAFLPPNDADDIPGIRDVHS